MYAWVCACVYTEDGVSLQQMLMFCQNSLVGILISRTRPQLTYRCRENIVGEWFHKSRTPDPKRTKHCSGLKASQGTDIEAYVGRVWMNTANHSSYTVWPVMYSMTGPAALFLYFWFPTWTHQLTTFHTGSEKFKSIWSNKKRRDF